MERYIKIYKKILELNFSNLLIYRANFINNIISSISWALFSILSILLLTSKTNSFFGWTRNEMILLTGGYSILIGIFHTFFTRNFEKMSEIVNYGRLDSLLTKPVDLQFFISTRYVNFTSSFRIIVGIFLMIYIFQRNHINPSIFQFIGFSTLLIFGLITLYSIWFLVISITFWFPKLSNLPDFMYSFTSIGRYPSEMLKELSNYLFLFLIPITIIITIPMKALINKILIGDIGFMVIVSFVMLIISRKFWLFALKFYTSAGG